MRRDQPPAPPPELPTEVVNYLQRLAKKRFFGTVTISFQAGKAGQFREERVMKVDELGQEER